jgi:hypothetical protein
MSVHGEGCTLEHISPSSPQERPDSPFPTWISIAPNQAFHLRFAFRRPPRKEHTDCAQARQVACKVASETPPHCLKIWHLNFLLAFYLERDLCPQRIPSTPLDLRQWGVRSLFKSLVEPSRAAWPQPAPERTSCPLRTSSSRPLPSCTPH